MTTSPLDAVLPYFSASIPTEAKGTSRYKKISSDDATRLISEISSRNLQVGSEEEAQARRLTKELKTGRTIEFFNSSQLSTGQKILSYLFRLFTAIHYKYIDGGEYSNLGLVLSTPEETKPSASAEETLQAELASVKVKVTRLESDQKTAATTITDLRREITTKNSELEAKTAEIQTKDQRIASLEIQVPKAMAEPAPPAGPDPTVLAQELANVRGEKDVLSREKSELSEKNLRLFHERNELFRSLVEGLRSKLRELNGYLVGRETFQEATKLPSIDETTYVIEQIVDEGKPSLRVYPGRQDPSPFTSTINEAFDIAKQYSKVYWVKPTATN